MKIPVAGLVFHSGKLMDILDEQRIFLIAVYLFPCFPLLFHYRKRFLCKGFFSADQIILPHRPAKKIGIRIPSPICPGTMEFSRFVLIVPHGMQNRASILFILIPAQIQKVHGYAQRYQLGKFPSLRLIRSFAHFMGTAFTEISFF